MILMEVNNDWWRGEGPLGRGIFPSNYVRKIEGHTNEKGAYGAPPVQYGGGGGYYPGQPYVQQQQQQPMYGQPVQYQPQPVVQQQEPVKEEKKQSKLGEFGKNYGKTFVNATAW
jgi:hypothetical protein